MTLTKFKCFFLEKINWCHPTKCDGTEKGDSLFYKLYCYVFYPIPWQENPCWCCASVRGLLTGGIMGFLLGYFIYGV